MPLDPIAPGDTVVGRAGTKYAGQVGQVSSTHHGETWVVWPGVASEPWDVKVHCATADLLRVSPEESPPSPSEHCEVCGKEIKTMIWRGTGVCGDDHRKLRAGESLYKEPK